MPDDAALRPVTFTINTPGDSTELAERIRKHEALGLREAVERRSCIVVGSGPSARDEALWARLWAEQDRPPVTVACNNALALFIDRGFAPTYWTACDPQEGVADFLPDFPPLGTTYCLASKCHPAVFAKLANRNLRIWRLDDLPNDTPELKIPCACSVTLVTQGLMRAMGFHRIETWGWDCSLGDNGESHAAPQFEPGREIVPLTIGIPGGGFLEFATTATWMAEITDAVIQARNFRAMGLEIIAHGPGAVAAALRAKGLQ